MSNPPDLISIILPLYRVKEFLPQAIASIQAQTYRTFECLCLDDGSNNGIDELAKALTQGDARFKVYTFENAGVATTRNRGLDLAQGQYITFIDQDDCYHPQFLEVMLRTLKETNADIVQCRWQDVEEAFDYDTATHLMPAVTPQVYSQPLEILIKSCHEMAVWIKLFKRSAIGALRFNPSLRGSDDALFTWTTYAQAASVVDLALPLYYYRRQAQAVTQQYPVSYALACIDYVVEVYKLVVQRHDFARIKVRLMQEFFNVLKAVTKSNLALEDRRRFAKRLKDGLKECNCSPCNWSISKQIKYFYFQFLLK